MKYTVEVDSYGTVEWYKEGTTIFHREGGPAVEWPSGSKEWYKEGKLHRLDGPAIEYANGSTEYWVNNKHLPSLDDFNRYKKLFLLW